MKVTVEKNRLEQSANKVFNAPSSPDTTNQKKRPYPGENIHPNENEEEEETNGRPSSRMRMTAEYTPAKDVEIRTSSSPSSSTPDSCISQKSINRQVSDGVVSRNMDFNDEAASPENKLIQHLTNLSEIMEPSLKRTDSLLVFDLLTDPKFANACMDVARGMKLLKEGLTTITRARDLLCGRTKSNYN